MKSTMKLNLTGACFSRQDAERAVKSLRPTVQKFADAVTWLRIYDRELKKHGLKADFEKLLGFNPTQELEAEMDRMAKAEDACQKWQAGTMQNPSVSYTLTGRSITDQIKYLDQWTEDIDTVHERIEDCAKGADRKWRAECAYADANERWQSKHPTRVENAELLGA